MEINCHYFAIPVPLMKNTGFIDDVRNGSISKLNTDIMSEIYFFEYLSNLMRVNESAKNPESAMINSHMTEFAY